ncbi:MAG: hypothetical protein ABH950_09605 [Candidatus Altiarchaeota archaeon]
MPEKIGDGGQQFATDFLVGVSIFTLLLSLTFFAWDKNMQKIKEKEVLDELLIQSNQAADILVKTQGLPENWENAAAMGLTVKSVGLAGDVDRVLSEDKVNAFVAMDYNYSKEIMGLGNYDYYFGLYNLNNNVINETGVSIEGQIRVQVRRVVTYKDAAAVVELSVWGAPWEGGLIPVAPI